MTRFTLAIATAFTCLLFIAPVHAAARDRVFVASYGSDSNPCTFGSPCKTFQQAVNVVAAGGEVTAIDSAGFGPINITNSVTVTSPAGVEAGIAAAANADAITVNAQGNDAVVLRGLTLDGSNAANVGIFVNLAGKIEITDCVVRDFTNDGIYIHLDSYGSVPYDTVHISDTRVMNNQGYGIDVLPTNGIPATADFDHVRVVDNGTGGVFIGQNVTATIENSDISSNPVNVQVTGNPGQSAHAIAKLRNVTLNNATLFVGQSPNTIQDSIRGDDWSTIYLSQVVGDGFFASGTDGHVVYSDGTNLIPALPNTTQSWAEH
jgi:hypothetical protein